ncbi:hypothetical protein QQM79_19635 [Marinobacteraceae bacterium S3BR75-40.1]
MYEIIAKTLVAVLTPMLIKWIVNNFSKDRVKAKKKRLEDLSAFLAWPLEKRSKLSVQEHFKYFFGFEYTFSQIEHALGLKNPLTALNLLKNHFAFVDVDEDRDRIVFRKKFETQRDRKKYSRTMNIYYFIGSAIALFPIFLFDALISKYGITAIPFALVFSVFVMMAALLSLREAGKPQYAENVLETLYLTNARKTGTPISQPE